ncbi:MAG TPA: leucyl aminopeptidase family protein [Candidatus Absconditabacterales bacterium]|nr:leucyl aminopeptidase family protein [Candidatus Absconditabacterales bacterium]
MTISLGKKGLIKHEIFLLSENYKGFSNQVIKQFFSTELVLGDKPFVVGSVPVVFGPDGAYYVIIAKIKNLAQIHDFMEDLVAAISALIKKSEKSFFLDLDKVQIASAEKKLLMELFAHSLYAFLDYKKEKITNYSLVVTNSETDSTEFSMLVQSLKITRDLVNDPAHRLHPEQFDDYVTRLFKGQRAVKITRFVGKQLQKMGMNGIYEVGRGSQHAPRLLLLEYKGAGGKKVDFGLIGKGVCFDAGGYNIKPTGGMEDMKIDMGGAATCLGALHYAAKIKLKKNIIVALPIVENLISGESFKPGDVITMYNGKTVEVGNTDAEGRLILADSLSYVEKFYKPELVLDFATLTGAQGVATGNKICAILGRDHELNQQIQNFSFDIKDRVWELPFYEPYFKSYKSHIADMNNISTVGRFGPGTITAGLFLSQFITQKKRVHFDIASPAYTSGVDELTGHGATGATLRLLIKMLESY